MSRAQFVLNVVSPISCRRKGTTHIADRTEHHISIRFCPNFYHIVCNKRLKTVTYVVVQILTGFARNFLSDCDLATCLSVIAASSNLCRQCLHARILSSPGVKRLKKIVNSCMTKLFVYRFSSSHSSKLTMQIMQFLFQKGILYQAVLTAYTPISGVNCSDII